MVFAVPSNGVTTKTQGEITPLLSTTQTVLSANRFRRGLILSNTGTDAVLIQFGTSAVSTTKGMTIPASTAVQFTQVPVDAIYVQLRASTGTNKLSYQEFE